MRQATERRRQQTKTPSKRAGGGRRRLVLVVRYRPRSRRPLGQVHLDHHPHGISERTSGTPPPMSGSEIHPPSLHVSRSHTGISSVLLGAAGNPVRGSLLARPSILHTLVTSAGFRKSTLSVVPCDRNSRARLCRARDEGGISIVPQEVVTERSGAIEALIDAKGLLG